MGGEGLLRGNMSDPRFRVSELHSYFLLVQGTSNVTVNAQASSYVPINATRINQCGLDFTSGDTEFLFPQRGVWQYSMSLPFYGVGGADLNTDISVCFCDNKQSATLARGPWDQTTVHAAGVKQVCAHLSGVFIIDSCNEYGPFYKLYIRPESQDVIFGDYFPDVTAYNMMTRIWFGLIY